MTAYRFGDRSFEAEGPYLTLRLRESHDVLGDPAALRARLAEDGYLFVRGLHDPAAVLAARDDILRLMAEDGLLDPGAPPAEGLANPAAGEPATTSTRARTRYKTESLGAVVHGARLAGFCERLLGGPVASYGFQWFRAAGPGAASPIHGDAPYMSRGTSRVASCWTPIGDVPPELGGLVLCLGSHRWERVRETYGRTDVDRDLTEGIFVVAAGPALPGPCRTRRRTGSSPPSAGRPRRRPWRRAASTRPAASGWPGSSPPSTSSIAGSMPSPSGSTSSPCGAGSWRCG